MKAAIIIPTDTNGDPWRASALRYVLGHYERKHPGIPVHLGEPDAGTAWSKGAAVMNGLLTLDDLPDVLVLADADSFLFSPAALVEAIELVGSGAQSWVVPHKSVYRLRPEETEQLHANHDRTPRKQVERTPYVGPPGGGITVISPDAFFEVGGIDERFYGWGGEDLAFGWALETLVSDVHRLAGQLFHLWHPHPAPDLRGSPESERLVELYKTARGFPRRMAEMCAGGEWSPLEALDEPVRFRMTANRKSLRLNGSELLRFGRDGRYETTDPDVSEALRRSPLVEESTR